MTGCLGNKEFNIMWCVAGRRLQYAELCTTSVVR
jgi:hypothetical protein